MPAAELAGWAGHHCRGQLQVGAGSGHMRAGTQIGQPQLHSQPAAGPHLPRLLPLLRLVPLRGCCCCLWRHQLLAVHPPPHCLVWSAHPLHPHKRPLACRRRRQPVPLLEAGPSWPAHCCCRLAAGTGRSTSAGQPLLLLQAAGLCCCCCLLTPPAVGSQQGAARLQQQGARCRQVLRFVDNKATSQTGHQFIAAAARHRQTP